MTTVVAILLGLAGDDLGGYSRSRACVAPLALLRVLLTEVGPSAPASPSRMATTVVTPSKWPVAPLPRALGQPVDSHHGLRSGWIDLVDGRDPDQVAPAAPARARSASSTRGYFSKSAVSLTAGIHEDS